MSPWKSIVFKGGPHTLAPTVLGVMIAVYQQFDPSRTPYFIDNWWYSPSLSHQVVQLDDGCSEPSIIILNLREGLPSSPSMQTHFMINLNTSIIHDKFKDVRYPCPDDITADLEVLREYIWSMYTKGNVARRNKAQKKLEVRGKL
jgi:hypothetical protein